MGAVGIVDFDVALAGQLLDAGGGDGLQCPLAFGKDNGELVVLDALGLAYLVAPDVVGIERNIDIAEDDGTACEFTIVNVIGVELAGDAHDPAGGHAGGSNGGFGFSFQHFVILIGRLDEVIIRCRSGCLGGVGGGSKDEYRQEGSTETFGEMEFHGNS